ncbi:cellulase family glycosylhydrolase [Teredinibacter waterburyi]|uniref:cellulase family glycosylhydrolase n=1 Tax=Teredinibacter waterburyi TaxID=1500538 RepID=UPI00165F045A|nr:cellulase family glycosylhydrolase [Teredinibacter waterburyi]
MQFKKLITTVALTMIASGMALSAGVHAHDKSNNGAYGFKGHHSFHGFKHYPKSEGMPYISDPGQFKGPFHWGGWHHKKDFVTRFGPFLFKNGRPFRFVGSNNYYPMYKSQAMVDSLFQDASDAGFDVMRVWGFSVVGNADLTDTIHSGGEGVYFHYWDAEAGAPAFNEGEDGLVHLDYILAKSAELGLKVVFPLTNNWKDFGGMDQMVRWRENQLAGTDAARDMYHDDFYTDEVIKQWYKDWISTLLNRTNSITGVVYKNDPTIMAWELANEPRCKGSGVYPQSETCNVDTLTDWADEISTYIKSVDGSHLVSVGDEGFFCDPVTQDEDGNDVWPHWTANCNEGVDTVALASLPNIDIMSFHAYPDHWGTDSEWTVEYIKRHIKEGYKIGKPVMLGEFGWGDKATRNTVYKEWSDTFYRYGGAGALYWLLSSEQDDGNLYPDWDGFTVYCPSPVCTTLSNFAERMDSGRFYFAPVADVEEGATEFETPISFDVLANDIAYGFFNQLQVGSIDLDPSTDAVEQELTLEEGLFTVDADGVVTFEPAAGFVGEVSIAYTVRDWWQVPSNEATIKVLVKAVAGAPFQLFSFEDGTQGWSQASWQSDAGVTSQSSEGVTDGASSLLVDVDAGGWFQASFSEPLDLSDGYETITLDISVVDEGTSVNVVLQLGDSWTWCEGEWGWVDSWNTSYQVDLLSLTCDDADLSKVQTMLVYLTTDAYVDNVWANGHKLAE